MCASPFAVPVSSVDLGPTFPKALWYDQPVNPGPFYVYVKHSSPVVDLGITTSGFTCICDGVPKTVAAFSDVGDGVTFRWQVLANKPVKIVTFAYDGSQTGAYTDGNSQDIPAYGPLDASHAGPYRG